MAADEYGNNINAVGVPITGLLAYAPATATIPSPEEGAAEDLELGEDFRRVGLLTEDGGFEWTEEPDGDPIEFWQDGYSIPTGNANVELTFTAAEESPVTRYLRTGKTPDANGYLTVDGGGVTKRHAFFSEEIFRNGAIRRRVAFGRVVTAKLQKNERGNVQGIEFTVHVSRHAAFNGEHYGEWVLNPADAGDGGGGVPGED